MDPLCGTPRVKPKVFHKGLNNPDPNPFPWYVHSGVCLYIHFLCFLPSMYTYIVLCSVCTYGSDERKIYVYVFLYTYVQLWYSVEVLEVASRPVLTP